MKRILLIIITIVFSLTLVGCSNNNTDGDSTNKDTLTVGMEADYAPFNWTAVKQNDFTVPITGQKNTYADGYDVQMAKLIAEKLNKHLIIRAIEWDGLLPALQSREIDVIIAGMSPTSERKEQISFSQEYYRSEVVMVVEKNSKYNNATKLSMWDGAKVVAQRGTLYDDLIPQISNVVHQTPLDTYSALAISVASGASDAFIAELPVAQSIVAANKNLKIVNFTAGEGFEIDDDDITVAVGLRKSDVTLLNEINNALDSINIQTRNEIMTEAVIRSEAEIPNGFFDLLTKYFVLFAKGTLITILLAVVGTAGGFIVSLLLVGLTSFKIDKKRSSIVNKVFKNIAHWFVKIYVLIFRGTPMIVQAMIFYYGIKYLGDFPFWTPLVASLILVTLNTAAYIAEIIRGSVNALDKGQGEATKALGMTHTQSLINVIYPQAVRNSLPAIGNEFIVNLKDTAVLSIIGVLDLFNATRQVVGATYNTIQPFIITAVIYLILTSLTSLLVKHLEKKGGLRNA